MIINLYVRGLPGTATEDEVRELFEPYGKVKSVKLIRDWNTRKLKGYGFVEMTFDQGLSAINALDGSDFKGQRLQVNRARPKREKAKASTRSSVNQRPGQASGNHEFVNPYHFVPVAKVCDEAVRPFMADNSHFQDRFREGTLSGRVICRMTTETDFFVGAGKIVEAKDGKPAELAPFELQGRRAIPASSIKGMLSSVMEAASNSALRVLEKKVYTRRREFNENIPYKIGLVVERPLSENLDKKKLCVVPLRTEKPKSLESKKKVDDPFSQYDPSKDIKNLLPGMPVYLDGYRNDDKETYGLIKKYKDYSARQKRYYLNVRNIKPKVKERYNNQAGQYTYFFLGYTIYGSQETPFFDEEEFKELSKEKQKNYFPGIFKMLGIGSKRKDNIPKNKRHEFFLFLPPDPNIDNAPCLDAGDAISAFHELADDRSACNSSDTHKDLWLPFTPMGRERDIKKVRIQANDIVYYQDDQAGTTVNWLSFSACWRDFCGNTQKDNHAPGYFMALDQRGYLLPPGLNNQNTKNPEELKLTPVCVLLGFVESEKGEDQQGGLSLAGRLFFSPGILSLLPGKEADSILVDEEKTLKILVSPKPPCPEFYFHGCNDRTKMLSKKELHPCGSIRPNGRKFYWHNNSPEPYATNDEYIKEHYKHLNKIRPVKKDVEFVFSIDFFNLTEFELSMLLYALKPSDNDAFRHQIGMGKPLGMGRIKVEIANLLFVDRKTRYGKSNLFDVSFFHQQTDSNLGNIAENFGRDGFHSMQFCQEASEPSEHNVDYYRNQFKEHVRNQYGNEWGTILEMIGDPGATEDLEVCYPPNPSGEEGENFKWWVDNRGKEGMRKPLPVIEGAKAPTLSADPRRR
jgi:CRISPR-associated protein (TIGR03986 family)